jgi:hypothetical protein
MAARAERVRRAQYGAGIATGVLAVLGLAALLFAPLVRGCIVDVTFTNRCPPRGIRYVPLPQTGLAADAWALLIGLGIVVVIGAAGAVIDARRDWRAGALPLWIATVLAFGACVAALRGLVGLLYLPSVLALSLAATASLARRQPLSRRVATTSSATPSSPTVPRADESATDEDYASSSTPTGEPVPPRNPPTSDPGS